MHCHHIFSITDTGCAQSKMRMVHILSKTGTFSDGDYFCGLDLPFSGCFLFLLICRHTPFFFDVVMSPHVVACLCMRFCPACWQGDQAQSILRVRFWSLLFVCIGLFCSRGDMLVGTNKHHPVSSSPRRGVLHARTHAHTLGYDHMWPFSMVKGWKSATPQTVLAHQRRMLWSAHINVASW